MSPPSPTGARPPPSCCARAIARTARSCNRTLANLSDWPAEKVQSLRAVLRGDRMMPAGEGGFEIRRSLPHGHVVAALATARQIGLDDLLPRRGSRRHRALAFGLIIARLLDPAAKLATARMLDTATASHSLGEVLDLGSVTARELYATLDWLVSEQAFIETALARRHLKEGMLVLYDVTSTYLEGRCCPLAQFGYSRDHRGDRPQLVIGLLCALDGRPVAVEVFEGNTGDPTTVPKQIETLKQRFNLKRVVLVGDRGMITDARIEATLRPAGLDWITALRAPAIQQLAVEGGPLQPSLFDTRDMAEITSPEFPGERLVVCKNPLLADERARKRGELLAATEKDLDRIQKRVQRANNPLRGAGEIGKAVGAVIGKRKMAKHFETDIKDHSFSFARNAETIAEQASSTAFTCVRTSLAAEQADAAGDRAFLQEPRPGRARLPLHENRGSGTAPGVPLDGSTCAGARAAVHAGLLPGMAHAPEAGAAAVRRPRPAAAGAQRTSPVAKAKPSPAARRKAASKRTGPLGGVVLPVHSFRTLLDDLATLTRNVICFGGEKLSIVTTIPTELQRRALDLMGTDLAAV